MYFINAHIRIAENKVDRRKLVGATQTDRQAVVKHEISALTSSGNLVELSLEM